MKSSKQIVVSGGFDDIRSQDMRFLEEASRLGELTVLLWTDAMLEQRQGRLPRFPLPERNYFLSAVRHISRVIPLNNMLTPTSVPMTQPMLARQLFQINTLSIKVTTPSNTSHPRTLITPT